MNTGGSDFAKRVYETVARIPRGKVSTYGEIASMAGNPKAARAVGMLMSRNRDPKRIPCHRVVGASGALVGYAFNGTMAKREKLMAEGVAFRGSRADLTHSRWHPEPRKTTR
jgi:O-6-methylguanine DNA methyltransferase